MPFLGHAEMHGAIISGEIKAEIFVLTGNSQPARRFGVETRPSAWGERGAMSRSLETQIGFRSRAGIHRR